MRHAEFIAVTEDAATGFAMLLGSADLETPVPTCPGWSLAQLAEHLGGVHRWARAQLLAGGAQVDEQAADAPLSDQQALAAWFREGATALVETLRELPEDAPCWALYPPARASTWAKRQALETTLHLWDATEALGLGAPISTRVAAAGVAEVANDMYPRQVALGRMPSLDAVVVFRLKDAAGVEDATARPVIRLGAVGELGEATAGAPTPADATLEVSAEDALLLLWKRRDLATVDARLAGSRDTLERVLSHPLVP